MSKRVYRAPFGRPEPGVPLREVPLSERQRPTEAKLERCRTRRRLEDVLERRALARELEYPSDA